MADEFNAILWSGLLSQEVAAAAGAAAGDVGVSRVSESLQPIFDPWGRPEFQIVRGERLWAIRLLQAATAAENSFCGVANTSRDFITVVTGYSVAAVGGNKQWQEVVGGNIAFTGTSTPNPADTRVPVV